MSDTLTDEHHDWVNDALGADPRAYQAPTEAASSSDGAQVQTASDSDESLSPGSSSQVDGGVENDAPQPATPANGDTSIATADVSGSVSSDDSAQDTNSQNPNVLAMAGGKKDNRPPPADGLDEGEGKNRDGTVKRKAGEGQSSDGDIIDEAVRDFGLTPDERQRLHNEISGRGLGRDEIRRIAQGIVEDRRATKKPNEDKDSDQDNDKPLESDDSTLAKIAALITLLGLSIVLIPSIAAAILDPEPATKLAAIGPDSTGNCRIC